MHVPAPSSAAASRTPSEARRARPLSDRLALRLPGLFIGALRLAFTRPPGSRLRRRILLAAIGGSLEAFNRRDLEVNTLAHAPGFRLVFGTPVDRPSGARDEYVGVEGLIEFLDVWLDVWTDYRLEMEEIVDSARDRVVLLLIQRATGRDALPIGEHVAMVMRFRDGRLCEQVFWRDPQAALRSEGIGGGTPPHETRR